MKKYIAIFCFLTIFISFCSCSDDKTRTLTVKISYEPSNIKVNDSVIFTAVIDPISTFENPEILWQIEDHTKKASTSIEYEFTTAGKYTVYATYKDVTGSCEVTVKNKGGFKE